MAEVKWTKRAQKAKRALYLNGLEQFGVMTAEKTLRKVTTIVADLAKWPTSGHPEQLLLGESPLYRARPINDRFRIIYWYDEQKRHSLNRGHLGHQKKPRQAETESNVNSNGLTRFITERKQQRLNTEGNVQTTNEGKPTHELREIEPQIKKNIYQN